jgi:hypothetical protein
MTTFRNNLILVYTGTGSLPIIITSYPISANLTSDRYIAEKQFVTNLGISVPSMGLKWWINEPRYRLKEINIALRKTNVLKIGLREKTCST